MTGIDAPTLWQVTYTVAGVAVASAAAGLLSVRLLARRSLATLLFVVAAVVIVSSMLVSPPAARAFAQSSNPSGLSARMRAITLSVLILWRTASFFMARPTVGVRGSGGKSIFLRQVARACLLPVRLLPGWWNW